VGDDWRRAIADGLAKLGLGEPTRLAWRTDSDLAQLAAIRAGLGIGLAQVRLGERMGLVRVLPAIGASLDAWVAMHEDLRRVPACAPCSTPWSQGSGRGAADAMDTAEEPRLRIH
jgi:DNA-binding transcriptional LysR family regulator